MSDLQKNYDVKQMTWNEHDRAYHEETVDVIYKKVAEVVIAQNERFFIEQEAHKKRIDCHDIRLEDHEKRIKKLEKHYLKKVVLWAGGVIVLLLSLSLIIF